MANNNNKFDIKKAIIPIIVVIIAIVCGLLFTGDWNAFLGSGDSGYSSVVSDSYASGSSTTPTTPAQTTTASSATTSEPAESSAPEAVRIEYYFRSEDQYIQHYEKHGHEFTPIFGEITLEEYLEHANALIASDADDILTKYEKEDGDFMYFRKSTEEFLVLSPDGYIRTYFIPTDGIDYWNRQ